MTECDLHPAKIRCILERLDDIPVGDGRALGVHGLNLLFRRAARRAGPCLTRTPSGVRARERTRGGSSSRGRDRPRAPERR